jgi:hypothetical protein
MIQDPERRGRDSKLDIITTIMCFFLLIGSKTQTKNGKEKSKIAWQQDKPARYELVIVMTTIMV